MAETLNAVSSIQGTSNLFVSLDKAFKFCVKFDVLASQDVAVVLECINFSSNVRILAPQALRLESKIFLFSALRCQLIVGSSCSCLQVIQVCGHVPVASEFVLASAHQVTLLSHFDVNGTRKLTCFVIKARQFVSLASEVVTSSIIGFSGPSEFKLASIGQLGKFSGPLLCLVEIVIGGLDAVVLVRILSPLHVIQIFEVLNFVLVARSLLLQLGEFVSGVVVLEPQLMTVVVFLGHVSLGGKDFGFTSGDLLAGGSNLSLEVVVCAVLLIKEIASVVDLFSEGSESEVVRVGSGFEVVVLEQLLVLQVAILCLNGVQLVSQSEVVLVSLLNLENLCFELRDQQVLLVAGQMHAVVVLSQFETPNWG